MSTRTQYKSQGPTVLEEDVPEFEDTSEENECEECGMPVDDCVCYDEETDPARDIHNLPY